MQATFYCSYMDRVSVVFFSCRLAKLLCTQIKERLRSSHESFAQALEELRSHHKHRLEYTKTIRHKVKKLYTPKVARLTLESFSFKDYLLHGSSYATLRLLPRYCTCLACNCMEQLLGFTGSISSLFEHVKHYFKQECLVLDVRLVGVSTVWSTQAPIGAL